MNRRQLKASLKLWQGRVVYRRARWVFYSKYSKRRWSKREKLIAKWLKLLQEAKHMVAERHRDIISWDKKHQALAAAVTGVTRYDGVVVAAWMVPYLTWARQNGWRGRLVSGWRDPNYSRSLCMRMCGAPSCPGRCAGLSSNHVGSTKPHGAVDVSDYVTFGKLMQRCPHQPRLINRLGARDPVHFSVSGN